MLNRILLALTLLIVPSTAFAIGESLTPNPVGRHYVIVQDRIGLNAADNLIMDQVATELSNFRMWYGALDPAGDIPTGVQRKVVSGPAYTVNASGDVTWPGTFGNLPIGNMCGDVFPYVLPGAPPAWLAGYTQYVHTSGATIKDVAWQTISTNQVVSILRLDRTLMTLAAVEERFTSAADTSAHLAGRLFRVNPDLWAVATAGQRSNWMRRVGLISLNVPVQSLPVTVQSLMHVWGPSVSNAAYPTHDRDMLLAIWAGLGGMFQETWPYPMPASLTPVP